jgi:hypothetical protein
MNKKFAQALHFHRRLYDRYKIVASPTLIDALLRIIKHDEKHVVIKQTNRVSIHIISLKLIDKLLYLPIVYDKKRKSLVTVLPQDATILKDLCLTH